MEEEEEEEEKQEEEEEKHQQHHHHRLGLGRRVRRPDHAHRLRQVSRLRQPFHRLRQVHLLRQPLHSPPVMGHLLQRRKCVMLATRHETHMNGTLRVWFSILESD